MVVLPASGWILQAPPRSERERQLTRQLAQLFFIEVFSPVLFVFASAHCTDISNYPERPAFIPWKVCGKSRRMKCTAPRARTPSGE
jgi:hypothetical protein